MHAEKHEKHLCISYLFNIQTIARRVINIRIKTANMFWMFQFCSRLVAELERIFKSFRKILF